MIFPVSVPSTTRYLTASLAGILFFLLASPILLTIFIALPRDAPIFTMRRCFYDGRAIDLFEFACPTNYFGDFLWRTRLNQLPALFNLVRGDVPLDARLLTLLDES
jgi:lipopolysaccharide/colanic/teichoic acid biosynthesis glycosyltransferase